MGKIKKILLITVGFISLGLGIVGIILPVLPTTSFLLLTTFCFVKSSERFDKWFRGTKIYKNHLEEFVNNRRMTLKKKWVILLTATAMLAVPFFTVNVLPFRIFLVCLLTAKYVYFFFKIDTVRAADYGKVREKQKGFEQ